MTLPKKIWKKNLLNRVAHSAMHGAHSLRYNCFILACMLGLEGVLVTL